MGIGAPLKAMKTEAEGGCTMMSAPTPSVRLADSVSNPLVSPTTMITSVTSTATAITVMIVRTGRCITFCTIMCPINSLAPLACCQVWRLASNPGRLRPLSPTLRLPVAAAQNGLL